MVRLWLFSKRVSLLMENSLVGAGAQQRQWREMNVTWPWSVRESEIVSARFVQDCARDPARHGYRTRVHLLWRRCLDIS
jgi:hypothetical protein